MKTVKVKLNLYTTFVYFILVQKKIQLTNKIKKEIWTPSTYFYYFKLKKKLIGSFCFCFFTSFEFKLSKLV